MSFKTVVVLGGGPIGLICAIEARQNFVKDVTIVEKRSAYTRTNVPQLQPEIVSHFKKIEVAKPLWQDRGRNVGDSVAFSRIEEELWKKASTLGVKMLRGYILEGLMGREKKKNGRYKSMGLTFREWDDKNKRTASGFESVSADLLILASGGGASGDPVIVQKLGFEFEKLDAHNYGAYGIFETGDKWSVDRQLASDIRPITNEIASGQIAFNTLDHNYLLVTLSQITDTDFKRLQNDTAAFTKVLRAIGKTMTSELLDDIKQVQKNMGLFEISVQRARQFYSPEYPAVIVGDAAVTPHPEAGSGIGTGFKGFQELQELMAALKKTHRSKDNRGAFMAFNDRYELHVSKKALEGTDIILRNLRRLLSTFKTEINASQVGSFDGLKPIMKAMSDSADLLDKRLGEYRDRAKAFMDILDGDTALPEDWVWDDKVGDLWGDIDRTYTHVTQLTKDVEMLEDRLDAIESKIKFS